jgi:hypothetical protein
MLEARFILVAMRLSSSGTPELNDDVSIGQAVGGAPGLVQRSNASPIGPSQPCMLIVMQIPCRLRVGNGSRPSQVL